MYVSDWKEQDGYSEAFFAIAVNFSPIFKIRAVKDIDGMYHPVVRDYTTGIILEESAEKLNQTAAKYKAMCLATSYLNHVYQSSIRNRLVNQR